MVAAVFEEDQTAVIAVFGSARNSRAIGRSIIFAALRAAATGKRLEACRIARSLTVMGDRMNWDRIQGNWKQVTGRVKEQWGKLTDDDLDVIAGRREQLAGKIQERYGLAKDDVEKQLSRWESNADDSWFGIGKK